jgi:hypothetical protein
VTAHLGAARYGEDVRVTLAVEVPGGYHAYAPGATDGLPLEITAGDGFEVVSIQVPSEDGHLTGAVIGLVVVRGAGDELSLNVRAQLCDDLTCYAPQTLTLRCPITEGTA